MFLKKDRFVLSQLVLRDFRIRYRNMSLGVFWSLANPLIMMGVLTFVFTRVVPVQMGRDFHLYVLCGLVVFNFFSHGWSAGTTSLVVNSGLIKRVPMVREVIPLATVLAVGLHVAIQIGLLLLLALAGGYRVNLLWLWLPVLFLMETVFICGLSLITSALEVYFRDIRYVVDSTNLVLFWLVPIFYDPEMIPQAYRWIHWYNPVAAVMLSLRNILFHARVEPATLLKMSTVSVCALGMGLVCFRQLRRRFADYL